MTHQNLTKLSFYILGVGHLWYPHMIISMKWSEVQKNLWTYPRHELFKEIQWKTAYNSDLKYIFLIIQCADIFGIPLTFHLGNHNRQVNLLEKFSEHINLSKSLNIFTKFGSNPTGPLVPKKKIKSKKVYRRSRCGHQVMIIPSKSTLPIG